MKWRWVTKAERSIVWVYDAVSFILSQCFITYFEDLFGKLIQIIWNIGLNTSLFLCNGKGIISLLPKGKKSK